MDFSRNMFKVLLVATMGIAPIISHADLIADKTPSKRSQKVAAAQGSTNAVLTPAESAFANQLSALHRQIFVMVFTPALRQEAMGLVGGAEGSGMGADMAVEQVISHHRDAPTMPDGTSAKPTKNNAKKKSYWTS